MVLGFDILTGLLSKELDVVLRRLGDLLMHVIADCIKGNRIESQGQAASV